MKELKRTKRALALALALVSLLLLLSACAPPGGPQNVPEGEPDPPRQFSRFLVAVEDEPDTVDFQCTTIHYTIAQNVFDRLVEMENDAEGNAVIRPSLAGKPEISEDRCRYTFRLRPGVTFSNGSPLTASDVEYTFTRLLTHPDSCNRDIVEEIVGAEALEQGKAKRLEGFRVLGKLEFEITLNQPFEAFLACLSMPGASILDAETTEEAGSRFGTEPEWTVGTGSFILSGWDSGKGMTLTANPNCWRGAPKCEGLELLFLEDPEEIRELFENGELDVLNLDDVGNSAEFYLHGTDYRDRLYRVNRISITYFALNESVAPLDDARVRKALQLALKRSALLDAAYAGRGTVENGIMPHGLYGFNPELPEIPFDPAEARRLLEEAGYPEGFDLTVSVSSASSLKEVDVVRAAADMWEKIGLRVKVELLEEEDFMSRRKSGSLACYSATWTADYNDPDNFFYTFFGNEANARFRSLCYARTEIMERVRDARTIADPEARIREYRELERIIVQEDAAWIPLFSRQYVYVSSARLTGMQSSWNGSVKNMYREMSVDGGEAP
ncbi:MAG: ABC transporter substrate-binding protein [Oscillospiraceae bacterium]|nr:ABC transporter substrate-binding protein [Oscillospiraceae bacterium]